MTVCTLCGGNKGTCHCEKIQAGDQVYLTPEFLDDQIYELAKEVRNGLFQEPLLVQNVDGLYVTFTGIGVLSGLWYPYNYFQKEPRQ